MHTHASVMHFYLCMCVCVVCVVCECMHMTVRWCIFWVDYVYVVAVRWPSRHISLVGSFIAVSRSLRTVFQVAQPGAGIWLFPSSNGVCLRVWVRIEYREIARSGILYTLQKCNRSDVFLRCHVFSVSFPATLFVIVVG